MAEFLLEILCDEIPPSLQKTTMEQFVEKFKKFNIQITESHYGARRWVLYSEWRGDKSLVEEKIERGPRVDSPEISIQKFCDKYGIIKEDLSIIKNKDIEYYCWKQITNLSEKAFLIKTILEVLKSITFPKTMNWTGNNGIKWIRPIINILAIYRREDTSKFELLDFEFAGVQSSTFTIGHQILKNNDKIDLQNINNINEYYYELAKNFVIVNQEDRRERIVLEIKEYLGFDKLKHQDLIDELICIAEYPKVMECEIKEEYLTVPHQLIAYTMIKNQRYIPLYSDKEKLSNKFLVVIDHNNPNPIMKQGYERVLNARLDDAKFFWEKMCNRSSKELIELLKTTQSEYIPELSVYDFNLKLDEKIPDRKIDHDFLNIISCDLGTEIITEFPALRGIIAEEYLKQQGKTKESRIAYSSYYNEAELYEPIRGTNDTIVFFKNLLKIQYYVIDKKENPSGSKDPFALFKCVENMFKVALKDKVEDLFNGNITNFNEVAEYLLPIEIKPFIINSIINFISSLFTEIIDKKIIEIILENKEKISSFSDIFNSLKKFKDYKDLQEQQDLLQAYKRICSLNKKYPDNYGEVDTQLTEGVEWVLYSNVSNLKATRYYPTELTNPINNFLDNARIEVEDEKLKNNRIALIKMTYNVIESILPLEKFLHTIGSVKEKIE